jgi:hypothetical protein
MMVLVEVEVGVVGEAVAEVAGVATPQKLLLWLSALTTSLQTTT